MEKQNLFKWKHYQPDIILLVLVQILQERYKEAKSFLVESILCWKAE